MSEIKITSVQQFVEQVAMLELKENHTRFFRGHSDSEYEMIPSIYREPYLIKNEHRIIQDAFTYCSEYFSENETLFEKLVKLQHYDYKTRLLDVTSNALVALFFAIDSCTERSVKIDEDKDGEVVILDIPDDEIKYPSSDKVAILSAISLRDYEFNIQYCIDNAVHKTMIELFLDLENQKKMIEFYENNPLEKTIENHLISLNTNMGEYLRKRVHENKDKLFINFFNQQSEIAKLLHDVRQDRLGFSPMINFEDISRVLCVRTKHSNPRILRQHGAFLLFGMGREKKFCANLSLEWQHNKGNSRLIIQKDFKLSILNHLQSFGISRQTLFPELDSQATHIISRYKDD